MAPEPNILERLRAAEAARRERERSLALPEALSELARNMTGVGGQDFDAERRRISDDTVGAFEREEQARAMLPKPDPMADEFDRAVYGGLLPEGMDLSTVPRSRLEKAAPALSRIAADRRAAAEATARAEERRADAARQANRDAAADARDQRAENRFQYQQTRDAELDQRRAGERAAAQAERNEAMQTPGGMARDPESAKKFRQFQAEAQSFRNAIEQMQALRERKGFEVLDRASVAQGKQLAAEARIAWKNMAGLGVLSGADLAMMDAVIPPDPLGAGTDASYGATFQGMLDRLDQTEAGSRAAFLRDDAAPVPAPTAPPGPAPLSAEPTLDELIAERERRRAQPR